MRVLLGYGLEDSTEAAETFFSEVDELGLVGRHLCEGELLEVFHRNHLTKLGLTVYGG